MIKGRFTVLGTKNSGKSALLTSFSEQVNQTRKLTVQTRKEMSAIGMNEQDTNNFQEKVLDIYQDGKEIISIQVADYNGDMLNKKPDSQAFKALNHAIYSSDVLYILINGDLFQADSTEKKLNNVKRKCARIITPYVSGYSEHNNGIPPKVIFVVTKVRQLNQTTMTEVQTILKEAFNFAFDTENPSAVQPYAVCVDTNDAISVQIPFLMGMYYVLHRYEYNLKAKAEADKAGYLLKIQTNQQAIDANENNGGLNKVLTKKQTEQLREANFSLRNEMWKNEEAMKNNAVWYCISVIRTALQNELAIYRQFLISDFTRGELEIVIPDRLTDITKSSDRELKFKLNFHKMTGKEIAFGVLFAFFNLIGIIGVWHYAGKKKHSICLLIVILEFIFSFFVTIEGINFYLCGGILGSIILLVSGFMKNKNQE